MNLKRRPPTGNIRRVTSHGKSIHGVITNKAGHLVQFESWAERSLLLRLDRDPSVVDYISQPEQFKYIDAEGKCRTHIPDFKVFRRNGDIQIHDVTQTDGGAHQDLHRRAETVREICQARGWHYIVHTDKTLPQPTELANLLALFRYRPGVYANQDVICAARENLSAGEPVPLRSLVSRVLHDLELSEPTVTAALCHLLWHGEIIADLNKKLLFRDGALSPDILVWIRA
jgi:hypothetical protein